MSRSSTVLKACTGFVCTLLAQASIAPIPCNSTGATCGVTMLQVASRQNKQAILHDEEEAEFEQPLQQPAKDVPVSQHVANHTPKASSKSLGVHGESTQPSQRLAQVPAINLAQPSNLTATHVPASLVEAAKTSRMSPTIADDRHQNETKLVQSTASKPGHPKDASATASKPGHPEDASATASKPGHPEDASATASKPGHPEDASATASKPAQPEDAADEPEHAPHFWTCIAVFFGCAILVLIVMIVNLAILQFFIRLVQSWQERVLNEAEAKFAASAPAKPRTASKEEPGITDDFLASLLNGDHLRLEALLHMADGQTAHSEALDIVQKACKANKLRLSKESMEQVVNGLLLLAKSVQEKQNQSGKNASPKQKLQKAMKKVRAVVKMKLALRVTHDEHNWSDKICRHEDTAEKLSDKYTDGHKDSMHGGYKDTKLNKALGDSDTGKAIGSYFASERWIDHSAILFIFFYSQACAVLYAIYLKERFPKMYAFMGPWLLVSRGEAMAIILLSMLMVMLLSRGLVTWLRKYVAPWSSVLAVIIDKNVLMHRSTGVMLVLCSALHVLGHFRGSIPAIIGETDSSKINAAFTYGTKIKFNFNTWKGAFQCWPAITGIILVCILTCFWALSNERVRRWSFELFHYPHLFLIIAWCCGLIAHGAKQWLGVGVPLGALAVAPVTIYYFLERMYDICHGVSSRIHIRDAVLKKKSVLLTIDIADSGMKYETGTYCMLKVPAISHFQWHPFTIASAGNQPTFQVLFAVVGDWTTQLCNLLKDAQNASPVRYPEICVRGGYGAPAEGMRHKKHIVMVGAGVGATPFLSFLSNICISFSKGVWSQFDEVESAVFYWVSREPDDFVWVNQYNTTIENNPRLTGRVSVRLCLSKSLQTAATPECTATQMALFWSGVQVALKAQNAKDLAAEMGAPTQFGRPDWVKEFSDHAHELSLKKKPTVKEPLEVSVFACGNSMLVESLEKACDTMKSPVLDFRLFAEEF